jgi:hypothetical protein
MPTSVFEDAMAAEAVPVLMAEHARSGVIYTPPTGDPVTLTMAMVGPERKDETTDDDGRREVERVRTVQFSTDPASIWGGVADPKNTGTITIDGDVWGIRGVPQRLPGAMVAVTCVWIGVVEITRDGYRG